MWPAGQRETYTDSVRHSPARPRRRHIFASADRGLGAGTWNLESKPKGRLLSAARRQPERMGMRESANRGHRNKAPLSSEVKWERPRCSLSPLALASASLGTQKSSRWGGVPAPQPRLHLAASHSLRGRCYRHLDRCHLHACSSLGQTHVLSEPQEQDSVGGPHPGLRLKISTKGHGTKDKRRKSLLTAGQTMH